MLNIISILAQFFRLQVSIRVLLLKIFIIRKLELMKRQLVIKSDCLLISSC